MNNLALIIEDDYDLSNIFAQALQATGFEARIIRDGARALTWLFAETPDVVVLDLHLPHVDGREILQQIRSDSRLKEVQVIIVTADARTAETLREEADLVLVKPVSFNQLRDLAARLRK